MKRKLLAISLAMSMLPAIASADFDLSAMAYDELLSLQQQVALEIDHRPEHECIALPMGLWEVGVDIPAGSYLIACDGDAFCQAICGTVVDASGNAMSYLDKGNVGEMLESGETWRVRLTDGMFVYVAYHSATLTPFSGIQ